MADGPPVEVEIAAPTASELFESDAPVFPHTGPSVRDDLAEFLEQSVRAESARQRIAVAVRLGSAPLAPPEEERVRDQFHRFFSEEARGMRLERRVNQREGWLSFRYALPFIFVFGTIAYVFYVQSKSDTQAFLDLLYLIAISVVWVMLWDPIEMLTFDTFQLRFRRRAFEKLAAAPVRFVYGATTAGPDPPVPAASGPPGAAP